jgi:hypothetical protein
MRTLMTTISTGLGEDVYVKVVLGEWQAYGYERNTITFPLIDLITASPDKIAGSLFRISSSGLKRGERVHWRRAVIR